MPQYHNYQKSPTGKIQVIPLPFWRRIPILKSFLPYFVGNSVRFILKMETAPPEGYYYYVIYERFSDEETVLSRVENNEVTINGNIIPREGNVEYSFGPAEITQGRYLLFTAQVINKDRWSLGCVGAIIGIILTVIAGIISGFIQVTPFWKIWIP